MIDRHNKNGTITFSCDTDRCNEAIEIQNDDFKEAWDEAKKNGWRTFKTGDVWNHKCPACIASRVRT